MKAVNPTAGEFAELARVCADGPLPFVIQLPNDQFTPVAVYANLRAASDHAFFLESVETGKSLGRYSFMGGAPRRIFACSEGRFTVADGGGKILESCDCQDPLDELGARMGAYAAQWPALDLPPLVGGIVGYLGYEYVHYFEPVGPRLPNELGMQDMVWMLPDFVVCFDHLHSRIVLSKCVLPEERAGEDAASLYARLVAEAEAFVERYLKPVDLGSPSVSDVLGGQAAEHEGLRSNFTVDEYKRMVERAKEYITAGDIFQVVPSQRFSMPLDASPLDVYRALRKLNPSSYMFALKMGGHEVVGSSPETQLRCEGGRMMMRPLAGTRPRTGDRREDARLAAELLADEKECAEHRMLVDLVRNDLGRVAKPGSVSIKRLMEVEHYSHVMHITSEVEADLAPEHSVFAALRATFPAGTLSGAPKVRAMQIINEFEAVQRNVYGGLVGYIDFAGNCDSCISIRMMVACDGKAHVQAGGGLVADSQAQAEHQESRNKAQAVLAAIATAGQGK